MLRIVVISLVVANLFLLGFQGSKPTSEPAQVVSPKRVSGDPRIPTIHLFSEMIENEDLLTGNRRCFSIGPFHTLEDRDNVRSSLLEVSTGIGERETEALVEKGYWVFMPPYVSLLEANQELLSLKALGLQDVGIIYDGEWKNAISLGYFLRQENAQRRKKSLEDRGYQPLIRVRRQSEPRYWLDYEQPPGSGLLSLDMRDRPNDFMQRPLPCPEERLPAVVLDQPSESFETPAQDEPVVENLAAQTQSPMQQVDDKVNAQTEPVENALSPAIDLNEPVQDSRQEFTGENSTSGPDTAQLEATSQPGSMQDKSTTQPEATEEDSNLEKTPTESETDTKSEPVVDIIDSPPKPLQKSVGTGPDPFVGENPEPSSEDTDSVNAENVEDSESENLVELPAEQTTGNGSEPVDDSETDGS